MIIKLNLEVIAFVSEDCVDSFRLESGKSFSGHHKKIILDLLDKKNNIDVSYLHKFQYLA